MSKPAIRLLTFLKHGGKTGVILMIKMISLAFLYFFGFSTTLSAQPFQKTIVTGHIGENEPGYPVRFSLYEATNLGVDPLKEFIAKTNDKGYYRLEIPLEEPGYFAIQIFSGKGSFIMGRPLSPTDDFSVFFYLLEPGDSIHINMEKEGPAFSGRGAEKFLYRQALEKKIAPLRKSRTVINDAYWESLQVAGMQLLNSFKDRLSPLAFTLSKADMEGFVGMQRVRSINYKIFKRDPVTKKVGLNPDIYPLAKKNYFEKELPLVLNNAPLLDTLVLSKLYAWYLTSIRSLSYCMFDMEKYADEEERNKYYNRDNYHLINALFSAKAREMLSAEFIVRQIQSTGINEDLEYCMKDFLATNKKDTIYKRTQSAYEQVKNILTKGALAENFTLPDTSGHRYQLKQFQSKVVVLDFWFTGCAPCKAMAPYMEKVKESLKSNPGLVFINISVDQSKEEWKKNILVYAPGPGISLYTDGSGREDRWIKLYQISFYPRLIIIDKKGRIYAASVTNPSVDNGKELLAKIREALKNS